MRNWTSFSQPILGGDMLVLRRAIAFLHGACLHVPKIYWNSQHECRCHWAPYIPLNATNCYRYLHKLLFIAVALFQLSWWHTVTVILKKMKKHISGYLTCGSSNFPNWKSKAFEEKKSKSLQQNLGVFTWTPLISQGKLRWFSTPLKFNIAPKNRQSQKETHLPTIIFQGLC